MTDPFLDHDGLVLYQGDCLDILAELADSSVDAVVTDPPYGINFMGKAWDGRAIEEAAQRGRDTRQEMPPRLTGDPDHPERRKLTARTGSAFANRAGEAGAYDFSLTGNRAFQQWVEQWGRELLRVLKPGGHALVFGGTRTYHRLAAGLEDAGFEIRDELCWLFGQGFPKSLNLAGEFDGWGTALKPGHEPIVLARKPFAETVGANMAEHGVGALHIAACGVEVVDRQVYERDHSGDRGHAGTRSSEQQGATNLRPGGGSASDARWPANVILDGNAADLLDEQSGELISGANPTRRGSDKIREVYGDFGGQDECEAKRGIDVGGASRFFYCAKVSRAERHAGIPEGFKNDHPTVKPIDLMRWLVRLLTPPRGVVLDPFLGSGTTGCAAALEGFSFVGIDQDEHYLRDIAQHRIAFWREHGEDGLRICAELDAAARERRDREDAGQLALEMP